MSAPSGDEARAFANGPRPNAPARPASTSNDITHQATRCTRTHAFSMPGS
ncbi:MAG TPA: hypothetical protein VK665_06725 [Candidatus Elarobacter sp.]|nr:hypothetical protein [Candidatus Elarobacter sp.]